MGLFSKERPWWTYARAPEFHSTSGMDQRWGQTALALKALAEGKTVYPFSEDGVRVNKDSFQQICDEMEKMGAQKVENNLPLARGDKGEHRVYVWPDTYLGMTVDGNDGEINISITTLDKFKLDQIVSLSKAHLKKRASQGRVFVMVAGQTGLTLRSLGTAAVNFEKDNYIPEVVTDFEHAVADISKSDPCGRIVVLDGPPGTGKTYLVRSLVNLVPEALFILVPSHMVSSMGDPGFIPLLLQNHVAGRATVLIVEDADACLMPRGADNISSISALLNLSDGIMGAMMDLRFWCTTNVNQEKLDDAVMRPGRLCKRIEVNDLNAEHANKIFKRLTGKDGDFDKSKRYTLATIYAMTKNADFKPTEGQPGSRSSKFVGFALPSREESMKEIFGEDEDGVNDDSFEDEEIAPPDGYVSWEAYFEDTEFEEGVDVHLREDGVVEITINGDELDICDDPDCPCIGGHSGAANDNKPRSKAK